MHPCYYFFTLFSTNTFKIDSIRQTFHQNHKENLIKWCSVLQMLSKQRFGQISLHAALYSCRSTNILTDIFAAETLAVMNYGLNKSVLLVSVSVWEI